MIRNIRLSTVLGLLLWVLTEAAVAQLPVDTVLQLKNIEIQGYPSLFLPGGAGVKRLDVYTIPTAVSVSTSEAISRLPSVITDMEGGVTYRGGNRTAFLIHGIPYGFLEEYGGDVLIQMPSSFFNRIDLHSTPAINRVPDGDAGLLDLSSAFTKEATPRILLTGGAGLEDRYHIGGVVNAHPGRFHITAKYNYRREYRKRIFSKTTTNNAGTTLMNNAASARPDVHLSDLRIGYDLTASDYLAAYGLYYLMDYNRYGGINNTRLNPAGEVANHLLRHRYNDQRQEAYAMEVSWQHTFQADGRLRLLFNYNNAIYDEDNDYKNEKPGTGIILAEDNAFVRQEKDSYYLSGDYQKIFPGGWLLNTGYIGRFRKESYHAAANTLKEGGWQPNPQKTDAYPFRRDIHQLYLSLAKSGEVVTASVGVQGEQSRQKVRERENTYYHVYPQLSLSYDPHAVGRISLYYRQRVIRPYGADLNDFVDYTDATHIRQGNPDLKNEYIHSLELSYRLNLKAVWISPAVYYRHRTNRIMEIITGLDDQTLWRKENSGNSNIVGVELSTAATITRFLSAGFSANIYRDEIDGRLAGYSSKKSLTCWDTKGSLTFSLTPTTELQFDAFYISDQLTPQGKIQSHSSVNAGVSHSFFQQKLRVNLHINNIFDTLGETTLIETPDLYMKQVRNRDARVTWLTLTYQIK